MKNDTHQQESTMHKIVGIFVNTVLGLSIIGFVLFKTIQQLLGL